MFRLQHTSSVTLALLATGLLTTACSVGGGGSSSFVIRRSKVSVAAGTPVAISGRYLAFLADEATTGAGGTDMNGDTDKIDSIAVLVDMSAAVETKLNVAATSLAWAGSELYMVVDEALDGRDWNGDTDTTDLVLLHVSALTPSQTPDFVDRVATVGTTKMVAVGTNLYYSSGRTPTNPTESNLFVIASSAPTTPIAVATLDAVGPVSPRILSKDEGMIFLSLDETAEARDLNNDTDMLDTSVLALLDGTLNTNAIHSTELAITPGSPLRAKKNASISHDWDVGFLVSETDQGATNFNDPALFAGTWKPSQCVGAEDTDTTDSVLHYLHFSLWDAAPVTNPPVNTGLVGCRRIAIVRTTSATAYIATISPEQNAADPNGAEGTCDLNGDGDTDDYVVRWVSMDPTAILPLTQAANIHALTDVAGGTHGLSELGTRFVIEVSEADDNLDINSDALKTLDLIGWLLPSGSANSNTPWDFVHGGAPGAAFVGASWMAETADRSRLDLALLEVSAGPGGTPTNINCHVPPVPGEDTDTNDSVPTFPIFTGSTTYLSFPGVAIAVQKTNAGITIARNVGFYRVSETEDSRDWNSDGLETGFDLFRTSLTQGVSVSMGALNSINGRPAIEFNSEEPSPVGAAFIADEQLQGAGGLDFNTDGDGNDLVISYFIF